MPVKSAASTDQGVLIVMTKFDNKTLSTRRNETIASIGPGLTWWDVYDWICDHGLVVVGARYAPVGVPGLLLGGGISYFAGEYGWAANNVVGYELVIANGTILEVTSSTYPDLFWALKGGSNNYGIVTRFDLRTFPEPQIYAGILSIDTPYLPTFYDAVETWVASGGGIEDSKAAIVPNIFIYPGEQLIQGDCVVFAFGNYSIIGGNQTSPAVLKNFTDIPTISSTAEVQSFKSFQSQTTSYGNRSYRYVCHLRKIVAPEC